MKKIYLCLMIIAVQSFVALDLCQAIPAYARKHGFNCNMCHTAFPKLNDFGQRFRDNGYQMPGQQGKEVSVFETPPPLAVRTSTGLSFYDSTGGSTIGLNLFGFDLLASGVLHKNISFMLIYVPRIDEPAADFNGSDNGRNPSQLSSLESANLVFSNLIPNALNVRVGRFEPAYHAFSSKRSFYLFSPYDVYGFTTPANTYSFEDNQIGLEASGHLRNGFKYGIGCVNGTGANPDNNKNKDVYVNLFQTFGRGDGQSAGQRIGVFGYYGWQPKDSTGFCSPGGEASLKGNKSFSRFGVDGSFNWKTLNLELLWMKGMDDKKFNLIDPSKKYEYTGWLAELDYALLMNNRLVTSLLLNRVSPPDYDDEKQFKAISGLVRYYLGDWSAVNVSIHGEYRHTVWGKGKSEVKANLFALLLDLAF